MGKERPVLLATADPILEAALRSAGTLPLLAPGCETAGECLEQLAARTWAAVVLSPALAPWPGALTALAGEIRSRFPQVPVLVVADPGQADAGELAGLEQAGVAVVAPGALEGVLAARLRGRAPAPGPGPTGGPGLTAAAEPRTGERAGQVIAVWGGKPGTGRSTLILAMADLLAETPGVRVCTVDLNPLNSSLALMLRQDTEPGSWQALEECLLAGSALTPAAVHRCLVWVRPQWALVTGPAGSDRWCGLLTPQVVGELTGLLRADFDHIFLDLPAGRGPVADAALSLADTAILTVSAFYPDVADTARVLEQALADGILTLDRCWLVLCPWVETAELPAADVSACLHLPVVARVPLQPQGALAAARSGQPVTRVGTPEARALADAAAAVAAAVTGSGVATTRRPRRSWLGA